MNKLKLAENLYARVRLCPTARCPAADGTWLEPKDDDWILKLVGDDGVVSIKNVRTDHVATLGVDRIHHYDHEPHRDWDGLRHGLLELRVQLVLRGNNIDYLPLPRFRPRRAHRPRPATSPR